MHKTIISLGISLLALKGNAQFAFIPENPFSVMSFDLQRLGGKMDLKKFTGYKMLGNGDSIDNQYFRKLVSRFVSNLEAGGVNLKEKFITVSTKDSMNASYFLIPLSNAKNAKKVIEQFNKDILWENQKLHPYKAGKGTFYISAKNSLGVAVYADLCIILNGRYETYYNYDEYQYNRAIDSVETLIDSIRGIQSAHSNIMDPKKVQDILIDTTRAAVKAEDDSIAYSEIGKTDFPQYAYSDDSIMIAFRAWWQKRSDEKELAWWTAREKKGYMAYLESIYALPKSKQNAMEKNADFKLNALKPFDIFSWFDYSSYFRQIAANAGRFSYYNEHGEYTYHTDSTPYSQTEIGNFLGEFKIIGHGDFNKGNTQMDYQLKLSDSLQKYYANFLGKGVNKKLFDYIKTPQLASLTSKIFNYRQIVNCYMSGLNHYIETENKLSAKFPKRSSWTNYGFTILEFIYVLLDKELLYETFSGATITAINGIIHSRRAYESWNYDDEGNYKPVTKYQDVEFPKFITISEIKHGENIDKLIAPFVKNRFLIKTPNYYYVNNSGADFPIYFVFTNNAMIVTNDSAYTSAEYLKLPPALDPAFVDEVAALPLYLEMNGIGAENLLKDLVAFAPGFKSNSIKALQSLNKISVRSSENHSAFTINFDFTNKSRCSLIDMMDMVEIMSE